MSMSRDPQMDLGFILGGLGIASTTSELRHCDSFCRSQFEKRVVLSRRCRNKLGSRRTLRIKAEMASVTVAGAEAETEQVDAKLLSQNTAGLKSVMDMREIMKILPHRYPFLLVDKVIQIVPGKSATGIKNVTMNEPFFPGHFPDRPIMPGVLQVEALAQLGGIVMLQQPTPDSKGEFFFGGVDGVRWRRPVLPGDTLVMQTTVNQYKPRFGIAKMTGKGYVDGDLAVEGNLILAMPVERKKEV